MYIYIQSYTHWIEHVMYVHCIHTLYTYTCPPKHLFQQTPPTPSIFLGGPLIATVDRLAADLFHCHVVHGATTPAEGSKGPKRLVILLKPSTLAVTSSNQTLQCNYTL